MLVEIRETMVYQAPAELGSLWQKFESMWDRIVAEQEAANAEELRQAQIAKWRREKVKRRVKEQLTSVLAVVFVLAWFLWVMILIRTSHTYRGVYSSPSWSCVLC